MVLTTQKHNIGSFVVGRIAVFVMSFRFFGSTNLARLEGEHFFSPPPARLLGHLVALPRRTFLPLWLRSAFARTIKFTPSYVLFFTSITPSLVFNIFAAGVDRVVSDYKRIIHVRSIA